VGPPGWGKTTLLNLIVGLDLQMEGHVSLITEGLLGEPTSIGFLFQGPCLILWLTVQQNLELVLPAATRARQTVQRQQWLKRVSLPDCAHLFPGQLSGGLQRRVALLPAFIVKPDVLLMDEPFQSLDAPTAHRLRILLQDLCERTRPIVLFLTHSLR
jgi:ABC-type nitrate/sulfonate/bicarbonate transport system ATPase subunit